MKRLEDIRRRGASRRLGMTLLELMVTVAIAGILAGVSLYSFSANKHQSACRGTIRTLRFVMSEARQQAQSSSLPVYLRFERLAGRGFALDNQSKLFVRWERLGCAAADNSRWGTCPAPDCLLRNEMCVLDDMGNVPSAADRTCCQSFGEWVEVADTLRVIVDTSLVQGDSSDNPLNRLCWNGVDSPGKVVAATASSKCVFADDDNVAAIPRVTLACVHPDDVSETSQAAVTESESVVTVDAMTGLVRLETP